MTHQRLEIYRELLMATDHPTAEALRRRLFVKLTMISLDTIYRTLATLAMHGIINRIDTSESLSRFDVGVVRHHHIICRECGEIMDFMWPLIDEISVPDEIRTWGSIDHKNVVVHGVCNRCYPHRQ